VKKENVTDLNKEILKNKKVLIKRKLKKKELKNYLK
jgi:hypothetical protein